MQYKQLISNFNSKQNRKFYPIHLKSIYYIVWICLFFSHTLLAQQTTTDITIVDITSKQALSNVYIFNADSSFTTTTNGQGEANISLANTNTDTLFFKHVSYELLPVALSDLDTYEGLITLYPKEELLATVLVTAGKMNERIEEVTNKVSIIDLKQIQQRQPATSADMLQQSGHVFVQKSQKGGGSPVIRGFEANKVLIVVDGVRMNNAIFRGGHLQNVITIDPVILERTEVVYGPGSVIYGSDALGGVMHFISKKPALSPKPGLLFEANAGVKWASATEERSTHVDFSIGGKKLGVLNSLSFSDFGNTRMGRKRTHGFEDWDKYFQYVTTIDGVDSLVTNPDPDIIIPSGYNQYNLLQKWYYQPSSKFDLSLNLQYSNSSNIPRNDRLNDVDGDGLKYAQWEYGPQKRLLTSLAAGFYAENALYDQLKLTGAFQAIGEDRINRRFGRANSKHREEEVQVYSFNADAVKILSEKHRLQYGGEWTHNEVQSIAYEQEVLTGERVSVPVSTRYPDGGSSMSTLAAYLRHKANFSNQLQVTGGLRFSSIGLQAAFEDTSFFALPYQSINDRFSAITGSLGFIIQPTLSTRITTNLSSGFRSPNIDDAAKVFDPNDEIVVVPNFDLKAEYAWNADMGIYQTIGNNFQFSINGFYNHLTNLIKRAPYNIGSLDSLVFDGDLKAIYANTNAGQARVYGFALAGKLSLGSHVNIEKRLNWTKGWDISNEQPLGHIPPLFGDFSINYDDNKLATGFWLRYNGQKKIEDASPNGEDKLDEGTEMGTPSWYTLNASASYQISKSFTFNASIENILDHHYKPFASGVSAPGRNFVFGVRVKL